MPRVAGWPPRSRPWPMPSVPRRAASRHSQLPLRLDRQYPASPGLVSAPTKTSVPDGAVSQFAGNLSSVPGLCSSES